MCPVPQACYEYKNKLRSITNIRKPGLPASPDSSDSASIQMQGMDANNNGRYSDPEDMLEQT